VPLGYLVPGQRVADQTEDNFTAGLNVNGKLNVAGGQLVITNIPIGPTALASIGTNSTAVAGQWWISDIWVPVNRIVTNVAYLSGGTATTTKCIFAIWDSYGRLVANTAVAGQVVATANIFQIMALAQASNPVGTAGATATTAKLFGPQQYFVGVQTDNTTAGCLETVKTATYINVCSAILAGTFGTVPTTITVPTTFTADYAPIVYLG